MKIARAKIVFLTILLRNFRRNIEILFFVSSLNFIRIHISVSKIFYFNTVIFRKENLKVAKK